MEDEKEGVELSNKKHVRVRQPPSIPFLWEEKPGIPKRDWKPEVDATTPVVVPPPVKLVASIPFNWEEKPGKPLPCFSPVLKPATETSPLTLTSWSSPLVRIPGAGSEDNGYGEHEMLGMDLAWLSFEDDPTSSSSSAAENRLASSTMISATPTQVDISLEGLNNQLDNSSSPASESGSSTSSYATGISSLVGDSFLECLFPMIPPRSGFLEKFAHTKKVSVTPPAINGRDFSHETAESVMIRRPPTLGELIMMSRRRSCQRKAAQRRKHNLLMKFIKKEAFGCCIIGSSLKITEGFHWKRSRARLDLI
ncbi:hypothetical protein K2173_026573 [Erythroxylum novogranatense]|uniref:Hydroxyproline-rich glycoprotein family protein n=1 Tax=Erythroxylum novogranatense TaxID=1862640 RepID=A0AAV8TWM7_9ROSI|nr:hypothetical protein K2173_026573 [Erythroxylum novogranatense]